MVSWGRGAMQLLQTQLDGTVLLLFISCMTVGYHWEISLFPNVIFPIFLLFFLPYGKSRHHCHAVCEWQDLPLLDSWEFSTVQNLLPVLTSCTVLHIQTNKVCHSILWWCTVFPMAVWMKGLYNRQQNKWAGLQ